MSSEQDFKKLSTSSGGGYKPLQELEDKLSEVRPETSKERALRQRLERQAELKYTAEDYARWSANRNRAIEENGTSNIYDGINEAKEAISNFFTPKRKDKRLPPFNPEEVLAHPELQGIKPVNIDPVSMAVDDIASLVVEGEEFIQNPTLAGAVSMAVVAIPGKAADKVFEKSSFVRNLVDVQNAGGASPWTADLSVASGKATKARNKAIEAVIKEDLSDLNLTFKPEYSPFAAQAVAKRGVGTQIGKKPFKSRDSLIGTIVHEELHHRWWKKGVEGYHHSPDKYVPNEKFYDTLDRYKQMRQYYKGKNDG